MYCCVVTVCYLTFCRSFFLSFFHFLYFLLFLILYYNIFIANGRVLIRGEKGHDIIQDLYPIHGEPIIDKPGKGSFYATDLHTILIAQNIQTLLVCGVTTEVCVHTTVREANDRGYYCIVIEDACASFFDTFHTVAIQMITAQNGIFGSVTNSINISTTILQQYNNNNNNNDKNDNDGKDKNDK